MTQNELLAALTQALSGKTVTKARRKGYHQKPKATGGKLSDGERAQYQASNDAECIKVFEKAGFKDVQPRINVLTYNKWIEKGRKVKAKEKSHRVNKFPLFHILQTDEIDATKPDGRMERKAESAVETPQAVH